MNRLKNFIHFLTQIPGYFKLYSDYEYEPDVYDFIINQYTKILCNRTRTMSKPTYYANDVIGELDKYYDECYEEEIKGLEEEIRKLERELHKREDDLK